MPLQLLLLLSLAGLPGDGLDEAADLVSEHGADDEALGSQHDCCDQQRPYEDIHRHHPRSIRI